MKKRGLLLLLAVFSASCSGGADTPGAAAVDQNFLLKNQFVLQSVDAAEFISEPKPFLAFDADRLHGRVCNSFNAHWELEDGRLIASQTAATRMLCFGQPGLDQLESDFFKRLEDGFTVSREEDRLVLSSGDRTLVFVGHTKTE